MKKLNLKTKVTKGSKNKLAVNIDRDTVTVNELNTNLETWANTENNLVLNFVHGNYDKKFDMLLKPLVTQRKNEEWAKDRLQIVTKHSDGHKFLSCAKNILSVTAKERLEAFKYIAETSFTTYAKNVSMRGLSDAINKIKKLKGIKKDLTNNKILSNLKSKKVTRKEHKKATANTTPILSNTLVESAFSFIDNFDKIIPKLKATKLDVKILIKSFNAFKGNITIATKK
jgi:hypothetical protein